MAFAANHTEPPSFDPVSCDCVTVISGYVSEETGPPAAVNSFALFEAWWCVY